MVSEDKRNIRNIEVALALSSMGSAFKLYGGFIYHSKALLVDGLTCIAGLIAGILLLRMMIKASSPPDRDHPYGHERLAFGGVLYVLIIYSFAAGIALSKLLSYRAYKVSPKAPIFAALGTVFYAIAIVVYKRVKVVGTPIAMFTLSEIFEGLISIVASLVGSLRGCFIDYMGAWIIEGYLIFELFTQSREFICNISDRVPPEIWCAVKRRLEASGFKIKSLRLRTFVPGRYQGDAVIVVPKNLSYKEADEKVDNLVEELSKNGIDIIIHIDTEDL